MTRRSTRFRCEQLECRNLLTAVSFIQRDSPESNVDGPVSIATGDLDGDGDVDILTAANREGELIWHENSDGSGKSFAEHTLEANVNRPTDVVMADLDGDTDLDVVASGRGDDLLIWFENRGAGQFGEKQIILTTENPLGSAADVQVVDIDNDNRLDVVAAIDTGFVWIPGMPHGFAEPITIAATNQLATGVTIADFDLDNDLDVAAITILDHMAMWFENDGTGQFRETHRISDDASRATRMLGNDVDVDGDLDLILTSALSNNIRWYENEQGVFENARLLETTDTTSDLGVVDVDGDSDLDLVASYANRQEIVWFELQSNREYGAAQRVVSDLPLVDSIAPADVNGDGMTDVVVASYAADDVSWIQLTRVDFTNDGELTAGDIDRLFAAIRANEQSPEFDLNQDGRVDHQDADRLIRHEFQSAVGDANLDGVFDTNDIILVFQSGKFQRGTEATWESGDWNGDGYFDTSDLIAAFSHTVFSG